MINLFSYSIYPPYESNTGVQFFNQGCYARSNQSITRLVIKLIIRNSNFLALVAIIGCHPHQNKGFLRGKFPYITWIASEINKGLVVSSCGSD